MEFKVVFGPDNGGPSRFYRIPSLVTTKNGVTVACADARFCGGMDNPNRIDKVVRRSFDCGETWGEYITAVREHGEKRMRSSAAIDPAMTYDESTGRIYIHYSHTPAGIGLRNSVKSTGYDKEHHKLLCHGLKKYIVKGSAIYTQSGKATPYSVDKNGDVYKGGKLVCNICIGGRFKEVNTSYLMMCWSDDDGETWSDPVCLNPQVKKDHMSFIGPGPGNGIVIKNGKYSGRIVVPIYYSTKTFPPRMSCCVIYSDDNAKTWRLGESPNNTRFVNGKRVSDMTVKNGDMLTESQLIEQADGTLKYFMRNHYKDRCVAVAYSKNGGESWEKFRYDESLPQPICQSSVISFESDGKRCAVFLNPADKKARINATVRLSEDDGESFAYSRRLKDGEFVYSSLTVLPDGDIGALFEPDTKCRQILFAKISPKWIKNNH